MRVSSAKSETDPGRPLREDIPASLEARGKGPRGQLAWRQGYLHYEHPTGAQGHGGGSSTFVQHSTLLQPLALTKIVQPCDKHKRTERRSLAPGHPRGLEAFLMEGRLALALLFKPSFGLH